MLRKYQHVDYLWDDRKAESFGNNQIALFLYRSNLLGRDVRITNYGGGNTSCKLWEIDPMTGDMVEVMWIKGSGGDLGTLTRSGIAGLYCNRLQGLKRMYKGKQHEDDMVGLLSHCLFDTNSKSPSIDTPLHGLLPFKHIDHLHPDAVIAVAASRDSERITKEIWGGKLGWVPWQRPGFDLALQLEKCLLSQPGIQGMVLAGHGLFTWGETSKSCYENSLQIIEQAAQYLMNKQVSAKSAFGGAKLGLLDATQRHTAAMQVMPILRGFCSAARHMVGHFDDNASVMEFVNSHKLPHLAPMGTSCPDHFLRTKIAPMILPLDIEDADAGTTALNEKLLPVFEGYRREYEAYYHQCKHGDSPPMRDPNPVVILWPGVGMFTFAKDKHTAQVAAQFYTNAINVMRGAEILSNYTSLPRQEAFDIEYWLLEEAKLQRMPKEKPLTGKIALVTGAGGGLGGAVAKKFQDEGACVVWCDHVEERLHASMAALNPLTNKMLPMDVTSEVDVLEAIRQAVLAFGGIDIVVHAAGLAISKPLEEHTEADWELLQDVLVKGQFFLAKHASDILNKQGLGGDIVCIASKNGLVAGPNNVGYGTAKAAQQHMARLLAAELGPKKVRVNTINPDGIILGSKIWEGAWAEGRARAYGITVNELPEFYAKRNLMSEIIRPEDVANAAFALVSLLSKTTGNSINVDGGMAPAFTR
ncbi:MAG: bifunctional rhamnulose-1-phosphate aldolase/short-chain dehydrogenase [Bacteroidetes bacterium]|nr:bifunctional rhamnulose-1-phosphate aldolase/short-chain dehydrogenase [Bacteroidota bacterium]